MRKLYCLLAGLFMLFTQIAVAQTVDVTGKVTEANGTPIPSASVKEKGTRNGVSADANGNFSIKVKQGATLVVSSIGFENFEVPVTGSTMDVKLKADTRALSEVVVTGTGVATSKKKLAFAVESITADKLPQASTADVGSALVGKIAGAQISLTNGSPGSPVNILLRGINSIQGGTNPMILLDGVQMAATGLESVDLNNVERVEVVQGPAAASMYGAQGANGVIQLFSKKGKAGKINIEFSTSTSNNRLLNIGEVQKAKNNAFAVNANGEVTSSGGSVLQFDPVTASYLANPVFNLISPTSINKNPYNKNLLWYDHYKMFFQSARTYNNSISISGAKEKMDFSVVASHNYQETVFKGNGDFNRSNISANIGVELAKGLRFRSTTQLALTNSTQLDPTGRNMLFAINNSRPFANYEAKDAAGQASPYFGDAVGVNAYNFNYVIENAGVKDQTFDILQSFNLNYKFPKFVEIDAKYGLNRSALNSRYEIREQSSNEGASYWEYWAENYSPRTSYGNPTTGDQTGEINQGDYVTVFQNLNINAYIKFNFEEDFHIKLPITSSTQIGWDYRKSNFKQFVSYGWDAPSFAPYTAQDMGNFKVASDYNEDFATYGYLINQRFDYGDYGGISAGFRSDWSSAFGQGATPFTFPRGDAYIRLSSFDFWQNSKLRNTVSDFKIRAAYGEAGIQPGAYDRFPTLTPTTLGTQSSLATPVTNRNPALGVETATELEIGTDIGLTLNKNSGWFKNANISFTIWDRKSKDVIDRVDVAPSLGYGRALTNAMTLASNGIQASLNLNVFSNKDWNWNFTTNFSKQTSIIESVVGNAEINKQSAAGSSQYILKAGEKIGQIYGYLFLNSIDQTDTKGVYYIPRTDVGLYEVASNGYVVNKTTKQPFATAGRYSLGDPNPDFNMSFINEVNYKGIFTFGMQWDWLAGANLYNQTRQWMYRDGIHKDYDVPVTIGGQTEAWTAFYRGAYAVRQANGTKSYFMEDASFLRLRNISFGVDVAKLFKIKGISKAQIVFSGRNLITMTKYTGYDPEVSSGTNNSSWDRAVDHNTIPNLKTYQVALNLGF
jgi:TonB-dependent starch-binding outer membrane protein SusC